jgi:hypothetical protein
LKTAPSKAELFLNSESVIVISALVDPAVITPPKFNVCIFVNFQSEICTTESEYEFIKDLESKEVLSKRLFIIQTLVLCFLFWGEVVPITIPALVMFSKCESFIINSETK